VFVTGRIYDDPNDTDDPEDTDGYRVLVDRLWPRGMSKERARLDLWCREAAPSKELRQWFHEVGPDSFEEFAERYRAELDDRPDAIEQLRDLGERHRVVLLYGTRDTEHNHAAVLADYLAEA